MTENGKTLTFVAVALALGVVALLARPIYEPPQVADIVGKPLFESFTDPAKAANLKIIKYDEDLGEVSTFQVAKSSNGLWSIPSHSNYPADAETQMKDAATCLVGVTVLGVASEDRADHELFGVIEPDQEKLKPGDKGVGLLVSFEDGSGSNLGSLIIGKQVKDADDQRFVRVPRQDQVLVVKMSPEKLSTKFEDWIEKDLLKINAFDVDRLRLKDHSVVRTVDSLFAEPRAEITVSLDQNGSNWKLDEMLVFRDNAMQKSELLPGEELNKEKLDALKNALSEVKIVDVFAKPKGLDASLKTTGDFLNDREAQRSLADRGFVLSRDNQIWSANGELQVRLKDGVEYVLRFGNVAGADQEGKEGKLNRYLFAMARVDESKFPEPDLEQLPSLPDSPAPATTPAPDSNPPAASPPTPETETKKDETKKDETKKDETKKDETKKDESANGGDGGQDQPPAEEKAAAPQADSPKTETAKPEEKAGSPDKVDEPAKPSTEPPPPAAPSEDEIRRKKIEADRERITKENQRKIDKWKDDKAKAEEKVRELNARFAPWYYVISEDVYKKIHLNRSDIIREGAKSVDEGTGVDAFRKLQGEGIKPAPAPAASPNFGAAPPPFEP